MARHRTWAAIVLLIAYAALESITGVAWSIALVLLVPAVILFLGGFAEDRKT